ncbi:MAG: tripartite tricarboxylate transporter substrate binding protein [Burkholderiaceae bacterium]
MTDRRRRQTLAALLALPAAAAVRAQAFPSRPIRVIVGYSPGGAVDIIARALGEQLRTGLGQPIVVENKPGAGTNIANKLLIDSPPDGYTLMLAANALAANVSLYQPPPYTLERITPVALVGRVPVVLATRTDSPVDSIKAVIQSSKAKPDSITYGSPGNGSTPHLAVALFESEAGIRLTHVPYKGGAPAITDVLGGQIQAVAVNALEVLPHVKAGKLRVLAVMSAARAAIFPDAPTVAESGFPGFEASVWYGIVGPAGLPAPIVTRLHESVQGALAAPAMRERLTAAGGEVTPATTARFAEMLQGEQRRYAKVIAEANIKPE